MSQNARVVHKQTKVESVIPVKAYNLLKKKYTLIGYEDGNGGELTEVQRIMAEKVAKKKAAEAAEKGEKVEVTNPPLDPPNPDEQPELEDLRAQYEAKFGKKANKKSTADTLKAKLNEA